MASLKEVRQQKRNALTTIGANPERPTFDLRAEKNWDALVKLYEAGNDATADVRDFSDIELYAQNGDKPAITWGGEPTFRYEQTPLFVHKGVIYEGHDEEWPPIRESWKAARDQRSAALDDTPVGVLVEKSVKLERFPAPTKYVIIRNGDEDHNNLVDMLASHWPTLSFDCLSLFFLRNATPNAETAAKLLGDGSLVLVDFTPDHSIPLNKTELKQQKAADKAVNDALQPKPPTGYSLADGHRDPKWHRSATIVIRDTRKGGKSILLGQDEGTYFGCELKDHPQTVKEAYDSLVPDAAKGQPYQRQGEWFIVGVPEKKVPKLEESIMVFGPSDDYVEEWHTNETEGSLALPIQTAGDNRHWIKVEQGRVGKDGQVYGLNGSMTHSAGEHAEIDWRGWANFHRNTALRSFSAEGVD